MRAEARAEVDAEVRAEDGIYTTNPYVRGCRSPAEYFYKKPVLCAAHVVGIADPVKYRKRLEAVEFFKRQQEGWNAQLRRDGPNLKEMHKDVYPAMYRHNSNNSHELRNKEARLIRDKDIMLPSCSGASAPPFEA